MRIRTGLLAILAALLLAGPAWAADRSSNPPRRVSASNGVSTSPTTRPGDDSSVTVSSTRAAKRAAAKHAAKRKSATTATTGGSTSSSATASTGTSSAGTCQAPQITAIRSKPSRIALRRTVRMYASRCASRPTASSPCRNSRIASAITVNGSAPSRRDSITSSHQRSGSSYPPASASLASGSIATDRPPEEANCCAAGRSQNRTGTPAATLHYGRPYFAWLADDPGQVQRFTGAMADLTAGVKAGAVAGYASSLSRVSTATTPSR